MFWLAVGSWFLASGSCELLLSLFNILCACLRESQQRRCPHFLSLNSLYLILISGTITLQGVRGPRVFRAVNKFSGCDNCPCREDLSLTRTLLLRILINIISDPRNFLYEICFENWMIVYAWSGSRIGWKALFAFLSIMAMVIALGSQLVGLLITACNL